jgi:hypothetical protein
MVEPRSATARARVESEGQRRHVARSEGDQTRRQVARVHTRNGERAQAAQGEIEMAVATVPEAEKEMSKKVLSKIERVHLITARCSGALHGHGPDVQGAVLADLLAMWLAGHLAGGGSQEVCDELLRVHVEAVRGLVPVNVAIVQERVRRKSCKSRSSEPI